MAIGSSLLNRLSGFNWYIRPEILKLFETVLTSKYVDNEKFGWTDFRPKIDSAVKVDSGFSSDIFQASGSNAIINIEGTMMKKVGWLDAMCGNFISMQDISRAIAYAVSNNSFDRILLVWDTPGGTADGIVELTNDIYKAREYKRVTSLISGQMCSAGYFAGSAADEIFASAETDIVGSIGVVSMHVDQSIADAAKGLKYTYIHAGSHKVDGNPHEPLSAQALETYSRMVAYDYEVFLKTIERNRGLTRDEVLKIADGQVFHAGEALSTKMIDGIATLNDLIRS